MLLTVTPLVSAVCAKAAGAETAPTATTRAKAHFEDTHRIANLDSAFDEAAHHIGGM
jgi:hypothetical protein